MLRRTNGDRILPEWTEEENEEKGGAYSGDRSCKSCLDDSMKWIEDPPSVVVVVSVGAYLVSYREYFVHQVL